MSLCQLSSSRFIAYLNKMKALSPSVLQDMRARSMSSNSTKEKSSSEPSASEEIEVKKVPVSDAKLFFFLNFVKLDQLTEEEKFIHRRHLEALKKREETYIDPATGYQVMTRFAHLQKAECCGNACRHCPYNHQKVPKEQRRLKFNSAFYR